MLLARVALLTLRAHTWCGAVIARGPDPLAAAITRIATPGRIVVPFAPVQFAVATAAGGAENLMF